MKYGSFVATLAFATLVLVGCGTSVVTPSSPSTTSSAASATIDTTTSTTDSTTASTSSVEVIELTSSTITYDGEHGRANGRDAITVTVTLDTDGAISDVSLDQTASHGESRRYQAAFANAIQSTVVGKMLDEATVGKVGGASYTSEAWNEAIATLVAQVG